ncbi:MAG: ribbon-helix-helix domain-containing protein [Gammaproteobacteria bacterium]|nr:ribbon-helix-helix domain-containing protein [Gammaproteobacteria bacterium]
MWMKIIQMTMDNDLVERVDARVKALGTTRSAFARDALRDALKRLDEKELEERHVAGYKRDPVQPGEFDIPEDDHAWGDGAWSSD